MDPTGLQGGVGGGYTDLATSTYSAQWIPWLHLTISQSGSGDFMIKSELLSAHFWVIQTSEQF